MAAVSACGECNGTGVVERNLPATEANPVEQDVEFVCEWCCGSGDEQDPDGHTETCRCYECRYGDRDYDAEYDRQQDDRDDRVSGSKQP